MIKLNLRRISEILSEKELKNILGGSIPYPSNNSCNEAPWGACGSTTCTIDGVSGYCSYTGLGCACFAGY